MAYGAKEVQELVGGGANVTYQIHHRRLGVDEKAHGKLGTYLSFEPIIGCKNHE